MQYALPSQVWRELGQTAPSRGAFWLIQMLGTRPSAEREPSRLKPFFFQQPLRVLGGDGQAFLEGERQALIGVNKFAGHIRLAIDIARAGVRIDDR